MTVRRQPTAMQTVGENKDARSWRKVIADVADIEQWRVLSALGTGMSAEGLEHYVNYIRKYRDKFVADEDRSRDLRFAYATRCLLSYRPNTCLAGGHSARQGAHSIFRAAGSLP